MDINIENMYNMKYKFLCNHAVCHKPDQNRMKNKVTDSYRDQPFLSAVTSHIAN